MSQVRKFAFFKDLRTQRTTITQGKKGYWASLLIPNFIVVMGVCDIAYIWCGRIEKQVRIIGKSVSCPLTRDENEMVIYPRVIQILGRCLCDFVFLCVETGFKLKNGKYACCIKLYSNCLLCCLIQHPFTAHPLARDTNFCINNTLFHK